MAYFMKPLTRCKSVDICQRIGNDRPLFSLNELAVKNLHQYGVYGVRGASDD